VVGEFAIMARKSGNDWFVGCMNANQPRVFEIKLDFLDPSQKYIAHIYSDDETIPTATKVKIERFQVDSKTVLKTSVSERGGQAIRIVPAVGDENYSNY
jgi:alpha-glucosidase